MKLCLLCPRTWCGRVSATECQSGPLMHHAPAQSDFRVPLFLRVNPSHRTQLASLGPCLPGTGASSHRMPHQMQVSHRRVHRYARRAACHLLQRKCFHGRAFGFGERAQGVMMQRKTPTNASGISSSTLRNRRRCSGRTCLPQCASSLSLCPRKRRRRRPTDLVAAPGSRYIQLFSSSTFLALTSRMHRKNARCDLAYLCMPNNTAPDSRAPDSHVRAAQ